MSDRSSVELTIGTCVNCGRSTGHPPIGFDGLKGQGQVMQARACSPECTEAVRRFAVRHSAQAAPSSAGMMVAALGIVTAVVFLLSGREMGRALVCVSLFAAGTTRLAYPDAIPITLAKRFGRERVGPRLQWVGVVLATSAVLLMALFVFRG